MKLTVEIAIEIDTASRHFQESNGPEPRIPQVSDLCDATQRVVAASMRDLARRELFPGRRWTCRDRDGHPIGVVSVHRTRKAK